MRGQTSGPGITYQILMVPMLTSHLGWTLRVLVFGLVHRILEIFLVTRVG